LLERWKKIDPDRPEPYVNYGITLAQLGRVREALPLFDRALQLRPDYAKARQMYDLAVQMLSNSTTRPATAP